jgi:hypothetical protein
MTTIDESHTRDDGDTDGQAHFPIAGYILPSPETVAAGVEQ